MGAVIENKAWTMGEIEIIISGRKNTEKFIARNSKISAKEQRLNK